MDTEVEYEMDLKLACVWNLEERIYADEVFGRGSYDRNDNRFVAGHWWHGCIYDRT